MYGSIMQLEHFHADCMVCWLIAQFCTWHINVTRFHCQSCSLYYCIYLQEYHTHKTICPPVFGDGNHLLFRCYKCLAKFGKGVS